MLLAVALWLSAALPASAASDFGVLPDYPVPNGHFYSQASGEGDEVGFAITDDDGARLYSEFGRLGGVDALGFPASRRFTLDGFTTQATQRDVLQWRPDLGQAALVNVFDDLSERGLDPTLAKTRLIPPIQDNAADTGQPWPRVVARHLALLDRDPAIKARYFADANPIADFGLPQGVGDFGAVVVIRCQRAAFQHWQIPTSFARPGDVTQVNAGDLAKEFGLVPPAAAAPEPADSVLVAPPGATIAADGASQAAAWHVATSDLDSLVRLDVVLPSATGVASGIVLDQNGHILTNEHVVDSAISIQASFANGRTLPARVAGVDFADDLAVVAVPPAAIGGGVAPATFGSAGKLAPGQLVVALGFSPYFPTPPATRLGVFQRLDASGVGILRSNVFILPGDSGGMLLDLNGVVVGVNDEIRFTHEAQQPLVGFSIDGAAAARIGQTLSSQAGPLPADLGAQLATVTPALSQSMGLSVDHGALTVSVTPGGPADQAGLTAGDVVVGIAGKGASGAGDVVALLGQRAPGDSLALTVVGLDGRSRAVTVVLGGWDR